MNRFLSICVVAFWSASLNVYASVCDAFVKGTWTQVGSVDGFFAWSRPTELVTARAFSPADGGLATRAQDERRAMITVETPKQCLGVLEGSSKPESEAFDPSGEVSLEKLSLQKGKDFLVLKNRIFISSVAEYGALFVVADGDLKRSLKLLLSELSYESSPTGDEISYPMKVSTVRADTLEYYAEGDKKKPKLYRVDFKDLKLIP